MIQIYPSLLSADFSQLGNEIARWEELSISGYHLDVMDGHFVPNLTMGPSLVKSLRSHTKKTFDVHLMVANPQLFLEAFAEAGADRLSFHVELEADLDAMIRRVKGLRMKVGLAINPSTSVQKLAPFLMHIDFVLVMAVEPGFAGGKFVPEALNKILEILSHAPEIEVVVDGAMSPQTAPKAVESGAKGIVAGSSLFKGGPDCYTQNLNELLTSFTKFC
tara:strand:- start:3991 stop:4647 length:657 start_codon:yes stop_codon:yes gene_type:complete